MLVQLEMCIKRRLISFSTENTDERPVWQSFDVKPTSETLVVQTFKNCLSVESLLTNSSVDSAYL